VFELDPALWGWRGMANAEKATPTISSGAGNFAGQCLSRTRGGRGSFPWVFGWAAGRRGGSGKSPASGFRAGELPTAAFHDKLRARLGLREGGAAGAAKTTDRAGEKKNKSGRRYLFLREYVHGGLKVHL